MPKIKPSQAPWKISVNLDGVCEIWSGETLVCVVNRAPIDGLMESNARMIEEAPEMFDLLRSMAQRVHQAYHEYGEPADCMMGVCGDVNALKRRIQE